MQYCYRHPDRETGLSCSECGRPICVDCMSRLPSASAALTTRGPAARWARPSKWPARTFRAARSSRRRSSPSTSSSTSSRSQGARGESARWTAFGEFALYGPLVADGDWWRLITAAFLHAGLLHIGFNMLALWWVGGPLEQAMGPGASSPLPRVGPGRVGGSADLEPERGHGRRLRRDLRPVRRRGGHPVAGDGPPGRELLTLIVINLVFTLGFSTDLGRRPHRRPGRRHSRGNRAHELRPRHVAYARITPVAVVSLIAIGVGSVLVAYWRVRGLA